ncbi:hypothetical protein SUGI_0437780 [Cryptomeria japonica]|nr:hypothetical protein SUGI_0437780 [Cryptomeria japonica]
MNQNVKDFLNKLEDDLEGFINTIENGKAKRGLSLDCLRKATSCMVEKDQRLKDLILKNKKDMWKNHNLFELVDLYSQINVLDDNFYIELNNGEVALQCIAPVSHLADKAQYNK